MTGAARPTTLLISALGGEGGGVLSNWVVAAAEAEGLWVQMTSIPGVAQRTGATTYYLELMAKSGLTADVAPVMALTPSPGNVDIVIASELLEAGRAIQNGYVLPDRTTLIASTHRIYAIAEKGAMADGRYDGGRVLKAAQQMARQPILFDMTTLAQSAGAMINAVLFGALAGSGVLPIPRPAFEAAITAGGIAVEANLKGFAAGFDLAAKGHRVAPAEPAAKRQPAATPQRLARQVVERFPEPVRTVLGAGVARVADYQNGAYAARYLDRLGAVLAADGGDRDFALTRETGRHLAVWMTYEDVIRVADLKTRASRHARVRAEVWAKPNEPIRVTEYLKPGLEEWTSILPRGLARAVRRLALALGLEDRLGIGLYITTTNVSGFLLLWLLARIKGLRPASLRFAEEQARIETWLTEVVAAAARGTDFALEVADCARLVKGYGDTHRRGVRNFGMVIGALAAIGRRENAAQALRQVKDAALADPEGDALDRALAALDPEPATAQAAE